MKYWLNVDLSTGIAKLHEETCIYCKPYDQHSKPINDTNSRGGWFKFESTEEAHRFYKEDIFTLFWQPCKICNPFKSLAPNK